MIYDRFEQDIINKEYFQCTSNRVLFSGTNFAIHLIQSLFSYKLKTYIKTTIRFRKFSRMCGSHTPCIVCRLERTNSERYWGS